MLFWIKNMDTKELKIESEKWEKVIKKVLFSLLDWEKYSVFLFGSRAKWDFRYNSDYDIGIEWKKPMDYLELWKIKRELDKLPYLIDIVDFNTVDESFKDLALKYTKKWD